MSLFIFYIYGKSIHVILSKMSGAMGTGTAIILSMEPV